MRINPATLNIQHNDAAIFTSRRRNCPRVSAVNVPKAIPRITIFGIALYLQQELELYHNEQYQYTPKIEEAGTIRNKNGEKLSDVW